MKIKIGTIPGDKFQDYRVDVMFDGYKWDFQAGGENTITDKVVLLEPEELEFLAASAMELYQETLAMEAALKERPDLMIKMGISPTMAEALAACHYDPSRHVRFMRFDFHPATNGWQISEVNSDVPAGYPEASILPDLAQKYFPGYESAANFGQILTRQLEHLAAPGSTLAYLHDTHTVEDYQILHFLGDLMEAKGYQSFYGDPAHLKWEGSEAAGFGGIVRYYPVEWLEFAKGVDWQAFLNSRTPSCNHPLALLTQSKRLPLVWKELGISVPAWERLLPATVCPSTRLTREGFILKPAFGRVGEGINIPGTMSQEEDLGIRLAAAEDPHQWVAQKLFESLPFQGLHLNFGVFVVDGEFAGVYARSSAQARIDADASELPVLVRGSDGRF